MNKIQNPLPDRPDDFTPAEMQAGAMLTREVYNQWLFRGIFRATHEADGPGTRSSYSFNDILTVRIISQLKGFNIPLKKASKMAHKIIEIVYDVRKDNSDWPIVYIVPNDKSFRIDLKDPHCDTLRINTDSLVNNICGRIEEM